MSATKRVNKEPWKELTTTAERNVMRDLAGTLPCYAQTRDGWYTASCYEARSRPTCANCLILRRLQRLLKGRVT